MLSQTEFFRITRSHEGVTLQIPYEFTNKKYRELHRDFKRQLKNYSSCEFAFCVKIRDFRLLKTPQVYLRDFGYVSNLTTFLEKEFFDLNDLSKWEMARQISIGMLYLYSAPDVPFGGLSAGNILITMQKSLSICYFGLKDVKERMLAESIDIQTMEHSLRLKPIEFPENNGEFNEKIDVFCYGLIIFHIWYGSEAFEGWSREEIVAHFIAGKTPPIPEDSDELMDIHLCGLGLLMDRCLAKNPTSRPSFEELCQYFNFVKRCSTSIEDYEKFWGMKILERKNFQYFVQLYPSKSFCGGARIRNSTQYKRIDSDGTSSDTEITPPLSSYRKAKSAEVLLKLPFGMLNDAPRCNSEPALPADSNEYGYLNMALPPPRPNIIRLGTNEMFDMEHWEQYDRGDSDRSPQVPRTLMKNKSKSVNPEDTVAKPMEFGFAPEKSSRIFDIAEVKYVSEFTNRVLTVIEEAEYNNETVLVKKWNMNNIQKNQRIKNEFDSELLRVSQLHHENIVPIIGGKYVPTPTLVYPKIEYSLFDAIENGFPALSDSDKWEIAVQVAAGMEFLHRHRIIHKSLHTNNILLTSSKTVKIIDFGMGKLQAKTNNKFMTVDESENQNIRRWQAPECLKGEFTEETDIYSFGLVLYHLWYEKTPYEGYITKLIEASITDGSPPNPPHSDINSGDIEEMPMLWRHLVDACWAKEPSERPSFTEITAYLTKRDEIEPQPLRGRRSIVTPTDAKTEETKHVEKIFKVIALEEDTDALFEKALSMLQEAESVLEVAGEIAASCLQFFCLGRCIVTCAYTVRRMSSQSDRTGEAGQRLFEWICCISDCIEALSMELARKFSCEPVNVKLVNSLNQRLERISQTTKESDAFVLEWAKFRNSNVNCFSDFLKSRKFEFAFENLCKVLLEQKRQLDITLTTSTHIMLRHIMREGVASLRSARREVAETPLRLTEQKNYFIWKNEEFRLEFCEKLRLTHSCKRFDTYQAIFQKKRVLVCNYKESLGEIDVENFQKVSAKVPFLAPIIGINANERLLVFEAYPYTLEHVLDRRVLNSEERRWRIAKNIAVCLRHCVDMNLRVVLHAADIQLTRDFDPKISGFELSKNGDSLELSSEMKFLRWMAPENLKGEYTQRSQIYSYGLLVYALWRREVPYFCVGEYAMEKMKMKNELVGISVAPGSAPDADASKWETLIAKCCAADPGERITFTQIVELFDLY